MEAHGLTLSLNTVWVVLTAAMIFFMEGGFALLEAGFVRSKNNVSIIMKVFVDLIVGVLAFYLVGFGFMFGRDHGGLIGLSNFMLRGNFTHLSLTVPPNVFWLFHTAFAVAAISIVSGAVAERMNFRAYVLFTAVMVAVIYPLSGHWVWGSGGWLHRLGMEDFAGSAVIHAMAGFGALTAAFLVGPRIDKYNKDGSANAIMPSNLPLAAIGTFVLWFGWFGFNAGSTLDATSPLIGTIAGNTLIASVAGGAAAMFYTMFREGRADVGQTINGILAGLVAITAGCAYVNMPSALLIGAIAGVLMIWATGWVELIKVDDPVGAVAVHGVNGLFGAIAVGLFATHGGLFTTGSFHLFGVQVLGTVVVSLWGAGATFVALKVIGRFVPLRVSKEDELLGLDLSLHGTSAYQLLGETVPVIPSTRRGEGAGGSRSVSQYLSARD
ncbi:ammonium transporter [Alicyclobacillus tolerans]|uniref:ammonium transporter n=1 Tax=Alicyclobacillus tolerans TaxID=90970 RepID=UPI001F186788|nr:ammonium transporter [Alicyclobacillus tolerans]MCF8564941.1 ammonium transporter [Alicyclobacillus tolerans]